VKLYACALVTPDRPSPADMGFTDYVREPCPGCKNDIWVGPRVAQFREKFPKGLVCCIVCAVEHPGTTKNTMIVSASKMLGDH